MIHFSRYRAITVFSSMALMVIFYLITFLKYGGFERSITFNGGIRISILLPSDMNRDTLEKAAIAIGIPTPQVKLTSAHNNQYDLEVGPAAKELLEKQVHANGDKKADSGIGAIVEERLLAQLKLPARSITARETMAASYGDELWGIATKSLLACIGLIGIYLALRFHFSFALGAALSLVHDVFLTIGFIGVARIEPSIPVVAAVLTIVGYSINDTIVIFDRIRKNAEDHAQMSSKVIMDSAMSQTLSRTLVTSILTLISMLSLLMGGAETLHDFAVVLIFGIIMGTYSSIFIAAHSVQYYEELVARFKR
ncbi:MAG: protein translocase subunit SecF [Spirochaetia bacterium]|nr:protein translocase subunit SecF [Spirochaetia bacterium]